jgi:hypothetical protein
MKVSEAQSAAPISNENWLRFISWQGKNVNEAPLTGTSSMKLHGACFFLL